MARFKDERARQQAVQKYGEAQLAFHMSRSQFALQLVNGRADIAVKMTAKADRLCPNDETRKLKRGDCACHEADAIGGDMASATVDPVAVFALADALAREDMRLRVAETNMLGVALGSPAEVFDMPRIGEPFKVDGFAPKPVIVPPGGQ